MTLREGKDETADRVQSTSFPKKVIHSHIFTYMNVSTNVQTVPEEDRVCDSALVQEMELGGWATRKRQTFLNIYPMYKMSYL